MANYIDFKLLKKSKITVDIINKCYMNIDLSLIKNKLKCKSIRPETRLYFMVQK